MPESITDRVADRLHIKPELTDRVLRTLSQLIKKQCARDGRVRVPGLGVFALVDDTLVFDPDRDLADTVNARYAGLEDVPLTSMPDETDSDVEQPEALSPFHHADITPPVPVPEAFEAVEVSTADDAPAPDEEIAEPEPDAPSLAGSPEAVSSASEAEVTESPASDAPPAYPPPLPVDAVEDEAPAGAELSGEPDYEAMGPSGEDEEVDQIPSTVSIAPPESPWAPPSAPTGTEDEEAFSSSAGEDGESLHEAEPAEAEAFEDVTPEEQEEEAEEAYVAAADQADGDAADTAEEPDIPPTPAHQQDLPPRPRIQRIPSSRRRQRSVLPVLLTILFVLLLIGIPGYYFMTQDRPPDGSASDITPAVPPITEQEPAQADPDEPPSTDAGDPSAAMEDETVENAPDAENTDTDAPTSPEAETPPVPDEPTAASDLAITPAEDGYTWVVGYRTDETAAETLAERFRERFSGQLVRIGVLRGTSNGRVLYRVGVGQVPSQDEANALKSRLGEALPGDAWLLRIQPDM